MKIFGFNITKATETPTSGKWAFSTPFLNIGKNNLSLPYINKYYTLQGIVQFGEDNLYPQTLNQMYYSSPIHSQCIDFLVNTVIGGGYEWETEPTNAKDQVEIKTFERRNKWGSLTKTLTRDWIIHRRVCVVIKRAGDTVKLKRLDPSTIRNHANLITFAYSSDWSRGMVDLKNFTNYELAKTKDESLFVIQEDTPGMDIYPIPGYTSALNWAFLDGEISYFHKNNLQNSIFPSIVIRRPKDFASIEEVEKFKAEISSKKGASEAGSVLVLTGNGKDDIPEFQSVPVNQNDKLFEVVSKQCRENIAMSHGINPTIIGIKTEGSLGNTQELKTAYTIYEKNIVMPIRESMEEILNELVEICGVKNNIVIKDFQIIDNEIEDATE